MNRLAPASPAITMAFGIFLIGAIETFPPLDSLLGRSIFILLAAFSLLIYIGLLLKFSKNPGRRLLLQDPIQSFALGTWIAGISVLCNAGMKYFPGLLSVFRWITIFNSCALILFVLLSITNFRRIFKEDLRNSVHGIILLSAVSTQSVVIMVNKVFVLPPFFIYAGVSMGLVFYLTGIIALARRYLASKKWHFAEDWTNTNCMIHGALSITGLAAASAGMLHSKAALAFWSITFALLILIEMFEAVRAVLRVKQYGFHKGLAMYHVTQWSRNFTFGMFYAFSHALLQPVHSVPIYFSNFLLQFLKFWGSIVLIALLTEFFLLTKHVIRLNRANCLKTKSLH